MSRFPFTHLNVHSAYSIVDGLIAAEVLPEAAKKRGMKAVAMTDHCNLFATVRFYKAALKVGVKPIIGCELLVCSEQWSQPTRLILLCQNEVGYRALTELISKAYLEGQSSDQPLVKQEWLTDHTEGLIALSGERAGDIGQALLAEQPELAQTLLSQWKTLFPGRFYIELQRTGHPKQADYLSAAIALAENTQTPVVATNAVRFLETEDFEAHEARVCIQQGHVLSDPKRPRHYTDQQSLRSPESMAQLFADIPSALENAAHIAVRCNVHLELGKNYLPEFPVPNGLSLDDYFAEQAQQGLKARLAESDDTKRVVYQERLELELSVISKMGFSSYFLIVADFIRWAKAHSIPVGPGRGSGAGSLVAYALKITDLDPIEHKLLFERFLNPERVSMPDFDIDFCMEGRDRVIEYVTERYGSQSVSQIITFGTMAARAVIRDVGRVLNHPYGFVDTLAKLVPFAVGMTIKTAMRQEEQLMTRYHEEEEVNALINLAIKLEGVPRNVGKHAGGVVIAPSKLTDFIPLYCEPDGEGLMSQFDKDDVEAIGLVKFDFLGLRTLTIIDWALKAINQTRDIPLSIDSIPMDDPKTFDLLKACHTTAVFQLESRGMKDLIRRLQPDCFEDIIALVALFRPGPLQSGMVDDFINRKHGRESVTNLHPALEPILRSTYGVILYQEQVMQIAQVLAGYTLGSADLLRRAMGKKKVEEMAEQRAIFVKGAGKNNVDPELANTIFDLMEKFAGYGFNKSHSAAYALLSYQTAWLKAHYPSEFMAAVLSSDMDNTDKVMVLIDDCKALGLTILPPSVNKSQYSFTVDKDKAIVYGLGAIKGVGRSAVDSLVEERHEGGSYPDIWHFCERLDSRKINRKTLEALVMSGAVDEWGIARECVLASLELAQASADQKQQAKSQGLNDLFAETSLGSRSSAHLKYPKVTPWTLGERLEAEKQSLGIYFSGHPVDPYRTELKGIVNIPLAELPQMQDKTVRVGGWVLGMRRLQTRKGSWMAVMTLDDGSGRVEGTVFGEDYQKFREYLKKDRLLIVEGEVQADSFTNGHRLRIKHVWTLDEARAAFAKYVLLNLEGVLGDTWVDELKARLTPYRGGECPVLIDYQSGQARARFKLGKEWWVNLETGCVEGGVVVY